MSQASIDALFAQSGLAGVEPAQNTAGEGSAPQSSTPPAGLRPPESPPRADIRRILGLSVPLSVTLAERDMPIETVLQITVGTIIEFNVPFDAELTLSVANSEIGKGQAVKIGENFGLQVTRIGTVPDRIDALGGG